MRDLCARLEVDEAALGTTIRRCNAERSATRTPVDAGGRRRVLVSGSAHGDTVLARSVAAGGCVVVDPPSILVEEDGDPGRGGRAPLRAPARSPAPARRAVERARTRSRGCARRARPTRVVAFYLEGDDGIRWELPELRAALEVRRHPGDVARPPAVRPARARRSMSEPRSGTTLRAATRRVAYQREWFAEARAGRSGEPARGRATPTLRTSSSARSTCRTS